MTHGIGRPPETRAGAEGRQAVQTTEGSWNMTFKEFPAQPGQN